MPNTVVATEVVYQETNILAFTTQDALETIRVGQSQPQPQDFWGASKGCGFLLEESEELSGLLRGAMEISPVILRGWRLTGVTLGMISVFAQILTSNGNGPQPMWRIWDETLAPVPTKGLALIATSDATLIEKLLAALERCGFI